MSTHNIGFYEEISKIIPELSSNMHLISSSDIYRNNIRFGLVWYFVLLPALKNIFDNLGLI